MVLGWTCGHWEFAFTAWTPALTSAIPFRCIVESNLHLRSQGKQYVSIC